MWKHKTDEEIKKNIPKVQYGKPVLQYTKEGVFIREWSSITEAAKELGNITNITQCCTGKQKSAYGFVWKFAKQ